MEMVLLILLAVAILMLLMWVIYRMVECEWSFWWFLCMGTPGELARLFAVVVIAILNKGRGSA